MPIHNNYAIDSAEHASHPQYRADIDGLRAMAVLAVVGFHAFPAWVKGGLIGVDVFFVISGFLISTIILGDLKNHRFSFTAFYVRRIRRIFPALLIVLISSVLLGWFALLADEYKQLGKHIAGGASFVSNLVLWSESSYFDSAADTKPLLHLWSLGVEEQFYILWPILLWAGQKLRLNLLAVIIGIAVISFGLNISQLSHDSIGMFYSPQTRFWELLCGAALAYWSLKNQSTNAQSNISHQRAPMRASIAQRNALSICGVLLIVIGLLFITKQKAFPGWWALLPTIGTVLIMMAGANAWINRIVLSNRVIVWFGLISYPLYLWHWPLLSFARIIEGDEPSRKARIGAVIIAVLLAWLTYQFIEKPIRSGGYKKLKTIALFSLMTATFLAGFYVYKMNGLEGFGYRQEGKSEFANHFENGLPDWKYFERISLPEHFRMECDSFDIAKYRIDRQTLIARKIDDACTAQKNGTDKTAFIWGDSHAQQLNFGLTVNLPTNWNLLQVASSGCSPKIVRILSEKNYCEQSNYIALTKINAIKPDVVIVAQNGDHNIDEMQKIAIELKQIGIRKIIFTGPTPHWTSPLPSMILRKFWPNPPRRTFDGIDKNIIEKNLALQKYFAKNSSVIFANVIDVFCNNQGCLTYIGDDKKDGITSYDYGHLTLVASDYLAKNLLIELVTAGGNKAKTD